MQQSRTGRGFHTQAAEQEAEKTGDSIASAAHAGGSIASSIPAVLAAAPHGIAQLDPRNTDAQKAARAKVVKAMEDLKKKFELGGVSEENGAVWSESELRRVDQAFSKMSAEERLEIKGLSLVRTDKLTFEHKGKTISVAGMATGGFLIQLTGKALRDNLVPLHEAGHIIQNRAVRRLEQRSHKTRSRFAIDVATANFAAAQKKVPRTIGDENLRQAIQALQVSMTQVSNAVTELMNSDETNEAARRDALASAVMQTDIDRFDVERFKTDPAAQAALEGHDYLRYWIVAVEKWMEEKAKMVGPRKNLTAFVALVTQHKLARKSFAPFTAHVASFWPEKPEEFLVQCYAVWRDNPNYLKTHARQLYDWFQQGGHLEKKSLAETAREVAPVISELASEVDEIFGPALYRLHEVLP